MEDIIIFRRKRMHTGQWMGNEKPRIKLEIPRGTFVLLNKTIQLMNVSHGDAIMFAFNQKERCAYVYKEEPAEDSYYLSITGRPYARFTSKELMLFFIEFFGIEKEEAVYFDVDSTPNEKGMFRIVPAFM